MDAFITNPSLTNVGSSSASSALFGWLGYDATLNGAVTEILSSVDIEQNSLRVIGLSSSLAIFAYTKVSDGHLYVLPLEITAKVPSPGTELKIADTSTLNDIEKVSATKFVIAYGATQIRTYEVTFPTVAADAAAVSVTGSIKELTAHSDSRAFAIYKNGSDYPAVVGLQIGAGSLAKDASATQLVAADTVHPNMGCSVVTASGRLLVLLRSGGNTNAYQTNELRPYIVSFTSTTTSLVGSVTDGRFGDAGTYSSDGVSMGSLAIKHGSADNCVLGLDFRHSSDNPSFGCYTVASIVPIDTSGSAPALVNSQQVTRIGGVAFGQDQTVFRPFPNETFNTDNAYFFLLAGIIGSDDDSLGEYEFNLLIGYMNWATGDIVIKQGKSLGFACLPTSTRNYSLISIAKLTERMAIAVYFDESTNDSSAVVLAI